LIDHATRSLALAGCLGPRGRSEIRGDFSTRSGACRRWLNTNCPLKIDIHETLAARTGVDWGETPDHVGLADIIIGPVCVSDRLPTIYRKIHVYYGRARRFLRL